MQIAVLNFGGFKHEVQLRLPGQEALNAIHPQPPNHQLIKVALRA